MPIPRLHGWGRQTAQPLDPPPTPDELVWWESEKKSVRRKEKLKYAFLVGSPFFFGTMLKVGSSHSFWGRLVEATFVSGFMAVVGGGFTWSAVHEMRMRSALVALRIRTNLRHEAELAAGNPPSKELSS